MCFWKDSMLKRSYKVFKGAILYFLQFHCTQNANFLGEFSVTSTGRIFDPRKSDFQLKDTEFSFKSQVQKWGSTFPEKEFEIEYLKLQLLREKVIVIF